MKAGKKTDEHHDDFSHLDEEFADAKGPPGTALLNDAMNAASPFMSKEQKKMLEMEAMVSYLRDIYWGVLLASSGTFWFVVFSYTYFFWFRRRFLLTVTLLSIAGLAGLVNLQHSKNAPRILPALFHIPRSHFPIWLERPGPALSLISAIGCGAVVGLIIYAVFGRTAVVYNNSRMYLNAQTSVPAGAFADAGRIVFNEDVNVDTHKSAGLYANDGNIYCVAAIKAEADDRVEFWAVGVDCCEAEGSFSCGPVTDEAAKAGLRVLDSRGIFPRIGGSRDYFEQARIKAEAALGLPQAGDVEPLYFRWRNTEYVKNAVEEYRLYAFICITISTGLYTVACAVGLWLAMQPTPKKKGEGDADVKIPKYGPDGLPRGKYGPDGMPLPIPGPGATLYGTLGPSAGGEKKFGANGMPV